MFKKIDERMLYNVISFLVGGSIGLILGWGLCRWVLDNLLS